MSAATNEKSGRARRYVRASVRRWRPACGSCGGDMACVAQSTSTGRAGARSGWVCACGGYGMSDGAGWRWRPRLGRGFVDRIVRSHVSPSRSKAGRTR